MKYMLHMDELTEYDLHTVCTICLLFAYCVHTIRIVERKYIDCADCLPTLFWGSTYN